MRRTLMLIGLGVAMMAAGCASRQRTPPPPPPPPFPPPGKVPPGAIVVPPGPSPFPTVPNGGVQPFPQAPPQAYPQTPPQSFPPTTPQAPPNFQSPPSFPQAPPGPSAPPSSVPPIPQNVPSVPQPPSGPDPLLGPRSGTQGPLEQAGYNWRPSQAKPSGPSLESQVLLMPPEPAPGKSKDPGVYRFYQDDPSKDAARPPALAEGKQPPPSIPKFQSVRKNVESGLRPFDPEGFDWLAVNGYKTVLYLRFPGSSDEADRKLVTDRKMAFLSLPVQPNELLQNDRDMIKEFFRYLQNDSLQPMYVYGQDEILSGGMWFLVFRLLERDTEEVALVRAASLGLRPGEGAAKETFDHFVRAGRAD